MTNFVGQQVKFGDLAEASFSTPLIEYVSYSFNHLTGILKTQSNGPLYNNTVIGTLAVDGWAVTFGTVRRNLGGLRPCPVSSSLY